tara:strand:- start:203 stop:469 length:267 start_codon:yes stop_codon:yes gene_type:complete
MKQKAIIILLSVLVIIQFLSSFWEDEPKNYDYLKDQYEEHQEKIDGLYIDLTRQKNEINELKNEISKQDSIIVVADKPALRELTRHFK